MTSLPNIRKEGRYYIFASTSEADRVRNEVKESQKVTGKPKALPHEMVHEKAITAAKENGINEPDLPTIRSFYEIQFGQYHGQSFRWLVENAMGYVVNLLCQIEAEGGNTGAGNLNDNKRQLKLYVESYPDGRAALGQKRAEIDRKRQVASQKRTSSLIFSRLPANEVARRLQQQSPPSKKAKLSIPSSSAQQDLGDAELLSQVEALEASQSQTFTSKEQNITTTVLSQSSKQELHKVTTVLESLKQPDEYPLPQGWKQSLPEVDRKWVSKALCGYDSFGNIEFRPRQLWEYPPQPSLIPSQCPVVDRYFAHRLLIWYPRKLMKVCLQCPYNAKHELVSAGNYPVVRQVLDVDEYYNLVTEYLSCKTCNRKVVGWSQDIIKQLDEGHRRLFPCILTYQYACDIKVVTLMSTRGLGNSAMQLQRKLEEEHSNRWLTKTCHYLSDCQGFANSKLVAGKVFAEPPSAIPTPKYGWLQQVYCVDVMNRVEEVKATITSTFGRILKMDSTKKVVKKLAGHSQGTAQWSTNVGNEFGQILMSVLTSQEGTGGLAPMVDGIVARYASAEVPAPEVLYVDRDCCGDSFICKLFNAWPELQVRLDIWHFMRRFTAACSTDAHQLYGVFMSRLSRCIFEWSSEDVQLLRNAKRSELLEKHVPNPSNDDVLRQLTKRELALHCRRQTRGTVETTRLIEELVETFMGVQGLDTLGVPLFDNEKMTSIWESQKRHVKCIQDPVNVSLYTCTGTLKKGTVQLPTYRCARGSTSLESFHNHLAKFIPGTSASDTHFQAYLLEGLRRWNENRARDITKQRQYSSYSGLLRHAVNDLSQNIFQKKLVPDFREPRKHTGEKIGLEYLLAQTNQVLQDFDTEKNVSLQQNAAADSSDSADMDEEDEGYEETFFEEDQTQPPLLLEQISGQVRPGQSASESNFELQSSRTVQDRIQEQSRDRGEPREAVGPDNVGGFGKVDKLAGFLFSLRDQFEPLSNDQADHIIRLWNNLSDYDKLPTKLSPRHKPSLKTGSVTTHKMRSKTQAVPGSDTVRRCFHGAEGGIAQRPDSNRYMELLIIKLCTAYPSPIKKGSKRVDRWSQVSRAYRNIRELISNNPRVLNQTHLALFGINNATLLQWYNRRTREQERQMLEQNIRLPQPQMTADQPLLAPQVQVPLHESDPVPLHEQHVFVLPPNTVGMVKNIRKKIGFPSESPANPESEFRRMTPVPKLPRTERLILPKHVEEKIHPTDEVAKSTKWYWRQREKKKAAGEYVKEYTRKRSSLTYTCGKCGKSRTFDTGHRQYYGHWYCTSTATVSYQEWRSSREMCRQQKQKSDKKDEN